MVNRKNIMTNELYRQKKSNHREGQAVKMHTN
jgi:hypothetical protein